MNVAEMAAKSPTVGDLNVDMRGLYLLAAPSTPAEVIEAVAERSEDGERLGASPPVAATMGANDQPPRRRAAPPSEANALIANSKASREGILSKRLFR